MFTEIGDVSRAIDKLVDAIPHVRHRPIIRT